MSAASNYTERGNGVKEHHDKDLETLLRHELDNSPKVRAVVDAYAELSESEKLLFRLAAGVNLDATVENERRRPTARAINDSPDAVAVGDSPDAVVESERPSSTSPTKAPQIQPLVQNLMETLLEDYPTFLSDTDIRNLQDNDYCKNNLGLKINNLPLLRNTEAGTKGSDNDNYNRYWVTPYNKRFYVCKEWWPKHHLFNARSLLRFVDDLADRHPAHPGTPALARHKKALNNYIAQFRYDA